MRRGESQQARWSEFRQLVFRSWPVPRNDVQHQHYRERHASHCIDINIGTDNKTKN
jgi:hypothetical protein